MRARSRGHPRRRPLAGLTSVEHHYLRYGSESYLPPDTASGFLLRDGAGAYHIDERAARRAWRENRDALMAETAEHGLIPWAARHYDGMPGPVSPYDHLRHPQDPDHWPKPD